MTENAGAVPPQPIPAEQLAFALPRTFETVEEERRHRKERLAAALRVLGGLGFDEGVAGHLTVRDPQWSDHFWVNPFGVPFAHVRTSDLALVDLAGRVVQGRHHINQAAFAVHAQIHLARPDAVAVVYAHSAYGRALSALGGPLEPITRDACAFYEDHAVFSEYTGVVVEEAQALRVAKVLGKHKAVILRGHGLLTVGGTVDAAVWWFTAMERACQVQLSAKAVGKPLLIAHEEALRTREQLGTDLVAWISYQPMYAKTVRAEPDLFE